jgi:hypothetical protein
MNGADHYREAERLIQAANNRYSDDPDRALDVAQAQVHATLALAAATALPPAAYPGSQRWRDWVDTVEPAAVTS